MISVVVIRWGLGFSKMAAAPCPSTELTYGAWKRCSSGQGNETPHFGEKSLQIQFACGSYQQTFNFISVGDALPTAFRWFVFATILSKQSKVNDRL